MSAGGEGASMDAVTEYRLQQLEQMGREHIAALNSVNQNLARLAILEERQLAQSSAVERSFNAIKHLDQEHGQRLNDHEKRLQALEVEAPSNRLVRGWVIAAMLAIIAAAGAYLADKALHPRDEQRRAPPAPVALSAEPL